MQKNLKASQISVNNNLRLPQCRFNSTLKIEMQMVKLPKAKGVQRITWKKSCKSLEGRTSFVQKIILIWCFDDAVREHCLTCQPISSHYNLGLDLIVKAIWFISFHTNQTSCISCINIQMLMNQSQLKVRLVSELLAILFDLNQKMESA